MELQAYFDILRRRWWVIILAFLVLVIVSYVCLQFLPNKYESTARLRILTPKSGGATYVDFNIYYATRIMNTYASLATSPRVIKDIQERLDLKDEPEIDVSVIADSELIKITVEEEDPALSAVIANAMAEQLVIFSNESTKDIKSLTERAIQQKLDQINTELKTAREEYKGLVVPYMETQSQISALADQNTSDKELYISLKSIYEQNIQLAVKDQKAMDALLTQITELDQKIKENTEKANNLQQEISQESILVDAAKGDITLKETEYTTLVTELDQIQALEVIQGHNQLVIEEEAVPPEKPSSPNRLLLTAIGVILSAFLAVLFACFIDRVDDTFQYIQQVDQHIDGSYFGEVYLTKPLLPLFSGMAKKLTIETKHTYKKIYRYIQKQKVQSLIICGTEPNHGISEFSADIAREFTASGLDVMLIDANISSSELVKIFPELKKKPGLCNYLNSDLSTGGISADAIVYETRVPRLSIIPLGDIEPVVGKLLSSKKMVSLVNTLKKSYGLVLIEVPPFLIDCDIDVLVNNSDGILVGFAQGRSKINNARYVSKQIMEIDTPVIGYTVLHT